MAPRADNSAVFRFYEELNDFLPPARVKTPFAYRFEGKPSIKDAIEALGVPHPEVDLILVNGRSVGFGYHLRDGDRVSVYPVFESLDISPLVKLRDKPLRRTAFVLDVHLGKLARLLRLLGFDALYRNDYSDVEIVDISTQQHRIILTRDQGLLRHGAVTHGYWIRSADPEAQAMEVLRRFDLRAQVKPFDRCTACNGSIAPRARSDVAHRLPPRTARFFDEFYQCEDCARVYWKGSHHEHMNAALQRILRLAKGSPPR